MNNIEQLKRKVEATRIEMEARMDAMKEAVAIWRDIDGYNGRYQVSNTGEVKSLDRKARIHNGAYRTVKGRILKQALDGRGYKCVSLWVDDSGKTHRVHVLVATAFIDKVHDSLVVNHINGIKTDNDVGNLEWVTHQQNIQHAFDTGLAFGSNTGRTGERHNNPRSGKLIMPCGDILIFKSQADVVREFGLGQSKVSMLSRGILKEHKGWKCFNKVALGVITGDPASEIVLQAMRRG